MNITQGIIKLLSNLHLPLLYSVLPRHKERILILDNIRRSQLMNPRVTGSCGCHMFRRHIMTPPPPLCMSIWIQAVRRHTIGGHNAFIEEPTAIIAPKVVQQERSQGFASSHTRRRHHRWLIVDQKVCSTPNLQYGNSYISWLTFGLANYTTRSIS